jgi:hypothetical protein
MSCFFRIFTIVNHFAQFHNISGSWTLPPSCGILRLDTPPSGAQEALPVKTFREHSILQKALMLFAACLLISGPVLTVKLVIGHPQVHRQTTHGDPRVAILDFSITKKEGDGLSPS